jgi:predicted dehydrogenase
MKTIRFGIIGCGLMGREFAGAAARWCHLPGLDFRPEIVAICNRRPGPFPWFQENFPSIRQVTQAYVELLANPDVDAVYVAVPHHLHQLIFCAAIEAGKHLMGEKPFGINRQENQAILNALRQHPQVFARCASQWFFYPAAQRIGRALEEKAFGRIIEVNSGFLHSGDLDPEKPLDWKRMVPFNGEYGCLGDLGLHVCILPFRAGWQPRNVRAIFSDIVKSRPNGKGGQPTACTTWDNATLLCETLDRATGETFPWTIKTQRIAPGQTNTWYLEILGTKASARFSTAQPKLLEWLEYTGGDQVWGQIQTGHESAFKTITGPIFEFGASDAILQMWASFLHELVRGKPVRRFAACATPDEAALSHRLFTAALTSQKQGTLVSIS